jgi:hypothetical protein
MKTGCEIEFSPGVFIAPNLPSGWDPAIQRLINRHAWTGNGHIWHSIMALVQTTSALKLAGLDAAIYQQALDAFAVPLPPDAMRDFGWVVKNLQTSGFVTEHYNPALICLGTDSSTYTLPPANLGYSPDEDQNRQFCGIEINGRVEKSANALNASFRAIADAVQPLMPQTPTTCGIHQHIEVSRHWTYADLCNDLILQTHFHAARMEMLFPEHRKHSRFCRPLGATVSHPGMLTAHEVISRAVNALRKEIDAYPQQDPGGHKRCGLLQKLFLTSAEKQVLNRIEHERLELLQYAAERLQSFLSPSGKNRDIFYRIEDARARNRLNEEIEDISLDLRNPRYYSHNIEPIISKGTVEERWMGATFDPCLVAPWFDTNYRMVQQVSHYQSAHIQHHGNGRHTLFLESRDGNPLQCGDGITDWKRFLNLPRNYFSQHFFNLLKSPRTWGFDLVQDPNNWVTSLAADELLSAEEKTLWPTTPVSPYAVASDAQKQDPEGYASLLEQQELIADVMAQALAGRYMPQEVEMMMAAQMSR